MTEKEKKEIKDAVNKSGFLTELHLLKMILDKGWRGKINQQYVDLDKGIGREIDLFAQNYIGDDDENLNILFKISLYIEVKKTNGKWIVFSTPFQEGTFTRWRLLYHEENFVKSKARIGNNSYFNLPLFPETFQENSKYFYEKRHGRTSFVYRTKSIDTSTIYGALMNACKATWHSYSAGDYLKQDKYRKRSYDEGASIYYDLMLPIVVVDGTLIEIHLDDKFNEKLEEVPFIPLKFSYSSSSYQYEGSSEIDFYPLIVTYDYFNEFLDDMEEWLERMKFIALETFKER